MPVEAKDIFEATSRSLRELLSENGLGLYIPPYQRPYGWDKGKVAKLLDDTLHGLCMLTESEDSFTFLGTIITIHDINYLTVQPIVRDEVPAKVLTVIDGQQRLCTLLLLSVCLHNQVRLKRRQVFKTSQPDEEDVALSWVNDQVLILIKGLGSTIYERQASGNSPLYPRIIRAFADQWSKKAHQSRYASPIAHLISSYSKIAEVEPPTDFRPTAREEVGEGERDLVQRYGEIRGALKDLSKDKDS